jgi:integrase
MPKIKFTKSSIARIKVPIKEQGQEQHFEKLTTSKGGPSLVLSVSYGGTRTWRVLFYERGKPRSRTLGTYPDMSIVQAREEAEKFDTKTAIASSKSGTFKAIAEDWVSYYVDKKQLRSKKEIVRHLTTYVYPEWEKTPIFEIRRKDAKELLRQIDQNHGASQADAVLATIRSVMNWYAEEDDDYNSPLIRGKGMKSDHREAAERARERILDPDEIRAVWKACSEIDLHFGALVKVLLLTGQRLRKVAHMRWDDIADGVWTIRKERREKGHAVQVKLPQMVLDILEPLPRIGTNPHVFPAQRGDGPVSAFSQRKAELDKKLPKMPHWVLHDLRRTARSLMAEIGIDDRVAERTLGHALQGMEAVYNRHPYFNEKSDALHRLAHHVGTILNPPPTDNVIAIAGKKKGRA